MARCQSRVCHGSVTPEYWIRQFYEKLDFDGRVNVIDNTNMTPEETAANYTLSGTGAFRRETLRRLELFPLHQGQVRVFERI